MIEQFCWSLWLAWAITDGWNGREVQIGLIHVSGNWCWLRSLSSLCDLPNSRRLDPLPYIGVQDSVPRGQAPCTSTYLLVLVSYTLAEARLMAKSKVNKGGAGRCSFQKNWLCPFLCHTPTTPTTGFPSGPSTGHILASQPSPCVSSSGISPPYPLPSPGWLLTHPLGHLSVTSKRRLPASPYIVHQHPVLSLSKGVCAPRYKG